MQRRLAAVAVMLAGVTLIGLPLVDRLFTRSTPFEELTGDFRPLFKAEVVASLRSDLTKLEALPLDLQTKLLPTIAAQLRITPDQAIALFSQQAPAVVNGIAAIPDIASRLDKLVDVLATEANRFGAADAIPTKGTSTKGIPWAILAAGIVAFLAGAVMIGEGRAAPVIAMLVGVALIIVPLVILMPSKAADADRLNANSRSVFARDSVDGARGALTTLEAMANEFQTKLIPGLASQLKVAPETFAANPLFAGVTQDLPAGLARLRTLVTTLEANVANYNATSPVSFRRITWVSVSAGIVCLAAGALGLAAGATAAAVREHRIRRALTGRARKAAAA